MTRATRYLIMATIVSYALGVASAAAQTPGTVPILVGAGDISICSNDNDEATAALLDEIDGTVFTLGDNVYEDGSAKQFADCYGPTWGRHKSRTRPSVGNHEYHTSGAAGYYGYFGASAGDPTKGYYSYELGSWHVIAINSNCGEVGGCEKDSTQEQWLRADLAANLSMCTLAYWHHPRFSSGSEHGNTADMQPIWQALYDHGADVVLSGHEHNYERFAKQTPGGTADPAYGIREFIVGTGGKSLYGFGAPRPNSELRNSDTYGVLKMTLHDTSYGWEFVPVAGETFTDSGSDVCHEAPPPDGGVTDPLPADTTKGVAWGWFIAAAAIAAAAVVAALAAARFRS